MQLAIFSAFCGPALAYVSTESIRRSKHSMQHTHSDGLLPQPSWLVELVSSISANLVVLRP
jgi:hypothetical protein